MISPFLEPPEGQQGLHQGQLNNVASLKGAPSPLPAPPPGPYRSDLSPHLNLSTPIHLQLKNQFSLLFQFLFHSCFFI